MIEIEPSTRKQFRAWLNARNAILNLRQPTPDFSIVERHIEQLLTRRRTGHENDVPAGQPERLRQEPRDGSIRGTVSRRRRNPDPQESLRVKAFNRISSRTGGDTHGESHA
jgi:hypothetical protein